ncbi:STAS domain-containing protein [Spirabiliibacterium falconis]|uniref:STAS domain-containing protein n=1 Tax=Spirabiliibacterium falconis TaxID=572023 RepID=UPI001AAD4EF6|nr:STAS domain-containing protein [Spirabiliibacterium falconis]MBE2895010.1 STAS domain-containing protein [Spirabiliibacterium falconis]
MQWRTAPTAIGAKLTLIGDLTRDSLLPLWQARETLTDTVECLDIELAELATLDSAGFALLCDIIHFYAQKSQVRLHHAPAILRDLALLYELNKWLDAFIVE